MNLQSKCKVALLTGVLSFSVAGQANAAIVDMTTGLNATNTGSNLVLSVWDPVTQASYTRDLGTSMTAFTSGLTMAGTTASAAAAGPASLSVAADATLTSFLAGITNTANLVWNVTAGRNYAPVIGTLATPASLNNQQYLTTSAAPITAGPVSNTVLKSFSLSNGYYAAASMLMAPGATSLTATGASGAAYAGGAQMGTNWGGQAPAMNSAGALGSALSFYFLTPSSASTIAKAAFAAFSSTWTLDAKGNLTYGNVAAVPEPSEWAMMLLGLALIGFIAKRRENVNSPMNFA